MEVSPEAREFGEITPMAEEEFKKLVDEGKVVVRGPEEQLRQLQDDLRKRGYRKMNFGPLKP